MSEPVGIERYVDAFKSVDWILPPYLQMGFISRLAAAIENTIESDKHKVLELVLPMVYDERHFASMFLGLFSTTKHVETFRVQISQAIEAYFSGLNLAAVALIMTVLEGVIRAQAQSEARDVGSGTRGIIFELNKVIEKEELSPNRFQERVVMLKTFRDFFDDRLLKRTKDYTGFDQLNRHGIFHGVFMDYGADVNFLRLMTLLELLCFIMGLYYGGSAFAPKDTPESEALASYYRILRQRVQGAKQFRPT